MNKRVATAVFAAAVSIGVVWVGLRLDFDVSVSPAKTGDRPTNVPQRAGAEELFPATPVQEPASRIEQGAETAAREDQFVRALAANIYENFNSPFVEFLVNRGLSAQDSERVIEDAFHQAATCWFTAVRAQAQAENRSFDPAFEMERGALANSRVLSGLSASCINSALERVGVNPPLGIKANDA